MDKHSACQYGYIEDDLLADFQAYEKDCGSCALRKLCLKSENQKTSRQIYIKLCIHAQAYYNTSEYLGCKFNLRFIDFHIETRL